MVESLPLQRGRIKILLILFCKQYLIKEKKRLRLTAKINVQLNAFKSR